MSAELSQAIKRRVGTESSAEVAARAVRLCDELSVHFARLVGDLGVRTLLARSAVLASARFHWLANTIPRAARADDSWTALSTALSLQDPREAVEGFSDLVTTFVGLLAKMIGEGLVARLLHEVWPELFLHAAEEIP